MIKKRFIIILLSCLLFASSCSLPNFTSGERAAEKINTAFIEALDAKDKDGIKALLCEYTLEEEDIDNQIEDMFDFFDDSVFPIKKENVVLHAPGSEETSWTDGVKTMRITSHLIIKTETNKCYSIICTAWPVCSDSKRKGVVEIKVVDETGLDYYNTDEYIKGINDPSRLCFVGG
ncbi:MAG: DUF5104 domain-containing protein [Oscillospiraceae bacterium]